MNAMPQGPCDSPAVLQVNVMLLIVPRTCGDSLRVKGFYAVMRVN
jgi:hypothetical protein